MTGFGKHDSEMIINGENSIAPLALGDIARNPVGPALNTDTDFKSDTVLHAHNVVKVRDATCDQQVGTCKVSTTNNPLKSNWNLLTIIRGIHF